uniref:Uncharacterized protein n=1 Tax=Anopheles farauti TaxID=69004 RepID=A0A182QXK0_9DIPT
MIRPVPWHNVRSRPGWSPRFAGVDRFRKEYCICHSLRVCNIVREPTRRSFFRTGQSILCFSSPDPCDPTVPLFLSERHQLQTLLLQRLHRSTVGGHISSSLILLPTQLEFSSQLPPSPAAAT